VLEVITQMSFIRPIIAGILLVVWMPSVNACALATAFPQSFNDCCDDSTAPDAPIGSDSGCCSDCATLEGGLSISAIQPLNVSPLSQREDVWLTKIMLLLSARAEMRLLPLEFCSSPPQRPLWQFIVETALPVRGPSIS
jgi:hypothetical protein